MAINGFGNNNSFWGNNKLVNQQPTTTAKPLVQPTTTGTQLSNQVLVNNLNDNTLSANDLNWNDTLSYKGITVNSNVTTNKITEKPTLGEVSHFELDNWDDFIRIWETKNIFKVGDTILIKSCNVRMTVTEDGSFTFDPGWDPDPNKAYK